RFPLRPWPSRPIHNRRPIQSRPATLLQVDVSWACSFVSGASKDPIEIPRSTPGSNMITQNPTSTASSRETPARYSLPRCGYFAHRQLASPTCSRKQGSGQLDALGQRLDLLRRKHAVVKTDFVEVALEVEIRVGARGGIAVTGYPECRSQPGVDDVLRGVEVVVEDVTRHQPPVHVERSARGSVARDRRDVVPVSVEVGGSARRERGQMPALNVDVLRRHEVGGEDVLVEFEGPVSGDRAATLAEAEDVVISRAHDLGTGRVEVGGRGFDPDRDGEVVRGLHLTDVG